MSLEMKEGYQKGLQKVHNVKDGEKHSSIWIWNLEHSQNSSLGRDTSKVTAGQTDKLKWTRRAQISTKTSS